MLTTKTDFKGAVHEYLACHWLELTGLWKFFTTANVQEIGNSHKLKFWFCSKQTINGNYLDNLANTNLVPNVEPIEYIIHNKIMTQAKTQLIFEKGKQQWKMAKCHFCTSQYTPTSSERSPQSSDMSQSLQFSMHTWK